MKQLMILMIASLACLIWQGRADAAPQRRAEAIFAGGCFWCTEYDLDKVPGVLSTTSGFTGGRVSNPTYKQVSDGGTGHFEAVRVIFDPERISYQSLVTRFLRTIDPTDANGQFCDRGSQYRAAIFFADFGQQSAARLARSQAEADIGRKVETLILPKSKFYAAPEAHQNYYVKNALKYKYYRLTCGRDARTSEIWSKSGRRGG